MATSRPRGRDLLRQRVGLGAGQLGAASAAASTGSLTRYAARSTPPPRASNLYSDLDADPTAAAFATRCTDQHGNQPTSAIPTSGSEAGCGKP